MKMINIAALMKNEGVVDVSCCVSKLIYYGGVLLQNVKAFPFIGMPNAQIKLFIMTSTLLLLVVISWTSYLNIISQIRTLLAREPEELLTWTVE